MFLLDTEDGEDKLRAQIVEAIQDHDKTTISHPEHIKFRCSVNEDQYEETLTYNKILQHIEKDTEIVWKFKCISAYEGPNTPQYKGFKYNVKVEWENGEITHEPLDILAKDDPVTCAVYDRDNSLLELVGWKRFKSITKREKKMLRMVSQAKLRSYHYTPKYKFGFCIPMNYDQAIKMDERNNNHKWRHCIYLELK